MSGIAAAAAAIRLETRGEELAFYRRGTLVGMEYVAVSLMGRFPMEEGGNLASMTSSEAVRYLVTGAADFDVKRGDRFSWNPEVDNEPNMEVVYVNRHPYPDGGAVLAIAEEQQ